MKRQISILKQVPSRRMLALAFMLVLSYSCWTAGTALALPEGRIYEMVSPVFKGGYGIGQIKAVSPEGESVAFYSKGAFAGAPSGIADIDYVAHRTPEEWSTSPLMPPAGLLPYQIGQDVSSTLSSTLSLGKAGPNNEVALALGSSSEFVFHELNTPDTFANWNVGIPLESITGESGSRFFSAAYAGASSDFCHLFVHQSVPPALTPEALEAKAGEPSQGKVGVDVTYEVTRGCNGEQASVHTLGLNNAGKLINPDCEARMGDSGLYSGSSENQFNAVAADGQMAFFTTSADPKGVACYSDYQVFARLGGERTIEISRPLAAAPEEECSEVPCAGSAKHPVAKFAGASEDGSRVYFTTTAPLVKEDKDMGNDLYMATLGCPGGEEECAVSEYVVLSLTQVSHDGNGGAAEVQGVARIAQDGSHVYFVAKGVLSGANAEGRSPLQGADNLYVYDATGSGSMAFVADLCSGATVSGAVEDRECPATLTDSEESSNNDIPLWAKSSEVQTAGPQGEFLVFSSYARLTHDDTDNAKDIFRYDANSGSLLRVSVGEGGYDAEGNNSLYNATILFPALGGSVMEQYDLGERAVSEDGSRIVFTSSEPLSPHSINHVANAYEWHEGVVSLVSSGSATEPVEDVVIDPTGRNVFFITSQALVSQDVDQAPDVYDARLEESSFPLPPQSPQQCSGDACPGPLTNPAPLLVPGSVSQAPGENIATPIPAVKAKGKKPKATVKKQRHRARKTGGSRKGKLVAAAHHGHTREAKTSGESGR